MQSDQKKCKICKDLVGFFPGLLACLVYMLTLIATIPRYQLQRARSRSLRQKGLQCRKPKLPAGLCPRKRFPRFVISDYKEGANWAHMAIELFVLLVATSVAVCEFQNKSMATTREDLPNSDNKRYGLGIDDTSQYANNRAELSHHSMRVREQGMRRCKSRTLAECFLGVCSAIYNRFNLGRRWVSVDDYRQLRQGAFASWKDAVAA